MFQFNFVPAGFFDIGALGIIIGGAATTSVYFEPLVRFLPLGWTFADR